MIVSSALVCILSLPSINAFHFYGQSHHPPNGITTVSHLLSMTSTTTNTGNIDKGSHDKVQLIEKYYGGDYAGHIAKFSQTTGKLIPVPDYYVPEALLEWGMIPSSFELLTSENIVPGDDDENLQHLNRVGIRVIPETGCGVDNLDTLVQKDSICISSLKAFESYGIVSSILRFDDTDTKFILEIIFVSATSLPPSEVPRNTEQDQGGDSVLNRVRVSLTIESLPQLSLVAPIEVIIERQTSNVSSEGKVVDGGGLTGSTVYRLIGDSANKPFSDRKEFKLDTLTGQWINFSNVKDGEVKEHDVDGYLNKSSLCTLSLPGNVIIQYEKVREKPTFPWIVEVSLIEDEGLGYGVKRRVMQRIFDKGGESTAKCWDEVKEVEI